MSNDNGFVVSGREQIDFFRLVAIKGAVKLEALGMKRRGESALSAAKKLYGLKGNAKSVHKQLEAMVKAQQESREADDAK